MKVLVPAVLLCLLAACNSDKVGEVCIPTSLRLDNDSIVYQYNDARELTAIFIYSGKLTLSSRVDLAYNNGKIMTVTQTDGLWGSNPQVNQSYSLEYGSDGMPSRLTEVNPPTSSFIVVTEFTHDSNKRLIKAISNGAFQGSSDKSHIGGYIYEYNDAGNVTMIKYVVRDFQNLPNTKEVVARENLTFDDRSPYYAGSKHLTTLNVYVYKYIPNANNVTKSRITYTSYNSFTSSPYDLDFTVTYDQNGRVTGNSAFSTSIPSWGDLRFRKAYYDCF